MRPIRDVAEELGLSEGDVTLYGEWKAKVRPIALHSVSNKKSGKLVLVTAMTPTPLGEGKTVTSIGLAMGLHRLGHKSVVCLRQPSLGPVFGIKGGAAGGGKATVEPVQEINMRLTGDIDAIGTAHNLLAAMLDNHLFHGNELGLDPRMIAWQRTVDMNDRALRRIIVGLGGAKNGVPREDGFIITAASEIMAVLSLARNYRELRERLARIIVGYSRTGGPVRASDLKAVGAMAAVLGEALGPNLVQTQEGTPALVHGGCFGNIAHGTSSLVSILLGLKLADYCVVEAGFGSDLGAEKFVDIAARTGGFNVDAAVVVSSVRALRHHGGGPDGTEGGSAEAVEKGLENLDKHIENVKILGLTPVVAINKFGSDTCDELELVMDFCKTLGVPYAVSTVFEEGSHGAIELSERVVDAARRGSIAKPLYPLKGSVNDKVGRIVREIYGGDEVEYLLDARRDIKRISELGFEDEPVCIAKTPLSLSDDPSKLGRPRGFKTVVRRVEPAAGAGFNVVYMGDIVAMPGLPKRPAAEDIDLGEDGLVIGLK